MADPGAALAMTLLPATFLGSAAVGALVAGLYLALLWACTRAAPRLSRPGLWMLVGAPLRVVAVCGGLWLASGGEALPLLAALAGFVGARTVALAIARRPLPRAAPAPGGSRR